MNHNQDIEFEEGSRLFQSLFDEERAKGYSEGESARRVICQVHAEKNKITKRFHAGMLTCEEFAEAIHIQHWIYKFAADIWNASPESVEEGWGHRPVLRRGRKLPPLLTGEGKFMTIAEATETINNMTRDMLQLETDAELIADGVAAIQILFHAYRVASGEDICYNNQKFEIRGAKLCSRKQ
jgi:hypothetical protein